LEVAVNGVGSEYLFVGVDLGDERFQVCVVDPTGASGEERSFAHDGEGIGEAIAWLKSAAVERSRRLAIAIESPRGAVVAGFLEAGFEVFSINPKQLDRFRDRFSVAGSKDDRLDARVLGDSLRTDPRAFRRLIGEPGWLVRMRQASRMEDELKQECRRSANRLRAALHEYHVELLGLLPSADEPWFWDLVAIASTPALGARLRPKQVERLLAEHRIRRITAQDVIERLRRRPVPAAPGVVDAGSTHTLMLVPRLHLLTQQLRQCQAQIQKLLDELGSEDHRIRQASIVTPSSSAPCRGPGDTWSPRCSWRPSGLSSRETTASCVHYARSPPSPSRAAAADSSTCATRATAACAMRSTTGPGTPRLSTRTSHVFTRKCGAAA